MYVERHAVTATTDGSGDVTAYTPVITGAILSIPYVKTDYTNGVDFVVTTETTAQSVWSENDVNASTIRCPRQAIHSTAGAALLYAAGGTAQVDPIYVAGERVKFVVSSGGASKVGTFYVTVG